MKSQNQLVCSAVISGHHGSVNYITQLSNGNLATCSDDSSIKIWDIVTNKLIATLEEHFSRVTCLVELLDKTLASGSFDTSIRLWDLSSTKCITQLTAHVSWVLFLLVLQDGRLASCSGDKTIRIWNIKNKTCPCTFKGHEGIINMIMQNKKGEIISCSEDKTIKFWDIKKIECTKTITFEDSIISLCELKSGKLVLGTEKNITIYEDEKSKIEEGFNLSSKICEVGEDDTIAYGNEDGLLIVKNITNGNKIEGNQHDDTNNNVINLQDGRLATCSNDALICVWEIK